MNLLITIATGSRRYGDFALNLALSVKAQTPEQKTALIYTATAIAGIEPLIEQHFDYLIQIPDEENPIEQAFRIKTELYDIVLHNIPQATAVIYMDGDAIMLPGKSVENWFETHKGRPFTIYCNDTYDFATKTRKRKDYTFWCDPEKAKAYFESKSTLMTLKEKDGGYPKFGQKIPQTDASWIYFEIRKGTEFVFDLAKSVWYDKGFEVQLYKGLKLAEFCFNIACATSIMPHQVPYRPLFLQPFSGFHSQEYIHHNFPAIGFAGMEKQDIRLILMYNKLCRYYRDYFGIAEHFVYEKEELVPDIDKRKIYGYWHVCMINDFAEITAEQLNLMVSSGLYERSEKIIVGCVGKKENAYLLEALFFEYKKIEVVYHGADISKYEFPTLKMLRQRAFDEGMFYAYYIHSKGVYDIRGKHWRNYLNYYNITKWVECVKKLREGYDIVGVKFLEEHASHPAHFSGNFFHLRSEYLKKLPEINVLDTSNRYNAEFWSCMANPKWASLCQIIIDHIQQPAFK